MDELTGAQVLERVGQKIRTLCEQIEKEPASCAEALSGELERCLQLWSECRVSGERRYVWSDGRDLPRAGECDALIWEGEASGPALEQLKSAGMRVYPLFRRRDAGREQTPYRLLPARDSAAPLFDRQGRARADILRAGRDALLRKRAAYVLLAGGAGTRYVDSVAALRQALESGALTDEQRRAVSLFDSIGMSAQECMAHGKLFAPLSAVMKKSAFEINMESIAEVLASIDADMPVIVFVSGSTRGEVCRLLEEKRDFGIANLAVAEQDEVPFVCEDDYSLLSGGDGCASGANGGGGIVYSLGHARPLNRRGEPLFPGTILQWMDSLNVEQIVFTQTDDAKSRDVYLGLSGVAALADEGHGVMAAAGSCYPTVMTAETPARPAFRLGSIWQNDAGDFRCIEYGELEERQIALLTDESRPEGRSIANTGMYLLDRKLVEQVIESGLLSIHFQKHKKETDAGGQTRQVTKFEYFLPDLYEIASKLGASCRMALLRDTSALPEPLRNMTVDALPAKDICKLALAQQAKLYCDCELARASGLTVEEGALVEIGPFAEIGAGRGVTVKSGARLYIGGEAGRPTRVRFGDGAVIERDARLIVTESADFPAGAVIGGQNPAVSG